MEGYRAKKTDEVVNDTVLTRRQMIAGAMAAGSYAAVRPDSSLAEDTTSRIESAVAQRENIINQVGEQFRAWFESVDGQEAYERGDIESILSRLVFIDGSYIKETTYDPLQHFTHPPVMTFDTQTGVVGGERSCNTFKLVQGIHLTAAHCLSRLGNVAVNPYNDIGAFRARGDLPQDTSTLSLDMTLRDEDVVGKLVVGIGYDDIDGATTYEERGIKLYGGWALKINPALISTFESLWASRDIEKSFTHLDGSFLYLSHAAYENAGKGLSGAPLLLEGSTLCGITSRGYQIPKATNNDFQTAALPGERGRDWTIATFPGPEQMQKHITGL